MEFNMNVNMDNDAFEDEQELILILNKVIKNLLNEIRSGKILDTNGNTVGKVGCK